MPFAAPKLTMPRRPSLATLSIHLHPLLLLLPATSCSHCTLTAGSACTYLHALMYIQREMKKKKCRENSNAYRHTQTCVSVRSETKNKEIGHPHKTLGRRRRRRAVHFFFSSKLRGHSHFHYHHVFPTTSRKILGASTRRKQYITKIYASLRTGTTSHLSISFLTSPRTPLVTPFTYLSLLSLPLPHPLPLNYASLFSASLRLYW